MPDEIASVPGATVDWWAAVRERIRQDMYSLSPDAGQDSPMSHRGYNLDHNLDLSFTSGGVRLAPGRAAPSPAGQQPGLPPASGQQPATDLYGHDAAGRQLPAHMELSGCGRDLRLAACNSS